MKKDPRFIDDSWVYSSRDPLRLKKRSPLGASSSQGDTYTKEFNPALDVSRIIGKQGDRVVYENNGLLVNWRYLKTPKTSGDHKKSTGRLQINYRFESETKLLASFEVEEGYAKTLLIYNEGIEKKISESTGMDFYQLMRHLYKNNSVQIER